MKRTNLRRNLAVLLFSPIPFLTLTLTLALPEPQIAGGNGPPGRGGNPNNGPNPNPNPNPAPSPALPWVSVNPTGYAITITPSVIFNTDADSGAIIRTTLNPPPSALLSKGIYTLFPGGTDRPDLASTYTGYAPVASATGSPSNTNSASGGGSFLACNRGQGFDEPFCLPKRGSTLHPGRTYYVTWSTTYFQPQNISIALQAHYHPGNSGFTTQYFPASTGFWTWEIPTDFLTSSSGQSLSSLNVTLSLVYEDTETEDPNDLRSLSGPSIIIAPETSSNPTHDDDSESGHAGGGTGGGVGDKRYALVIAVPIIIVIVLAGLAGFCFFKYRRNGVLPIIGGLGRRKSTSGRGGGYGERQSRAQRVGSGSGSGGFGGHGGIDDKQGATDTNVGIQLTDRDSWSPTGTTAPAPGRNVFREEIQRQERQG